MMKFNSKTEIIITAAFVAVAKARNQKNDPEILANISLLLIIYFKYIGKFLILKYIFFYNNAMG